MVHKLSSGSLTTRGASERYLPQGSVHHIYHKPDHVDFDSGSLLAQKDRRRRDFQIHKGLLQWDCHGVVGGDEVVTNAITL
jgi:hypothetical protein